MCSPKFKPSTHWRGGMVGTLPSLGGKSLLPPEVNPVIQTTMSIWKCFKPLMVINILLHGSRTWAIQYRSVIPFGVSQWTRYTAVQRIMRRPFKLWSMVWGSKEIQTVYKHVDGWCGLTSEVFLRWFTPVCFNIITRLIKLTFWPNTLLFSFPYVQPDNGYLVSRNI